MKTYFYIIVILFISCNNVEQNKSTDALEVLVADKSNTIEIPQPIIDSLDFITKCDTIPSKFIEFSRKRHSLLTFQKQTYIYCSPSTESQIIDSVQFNTEIISWKPIIRSYKPEEIERNGKLITINTAKENWYETTINGQTGYLSENGLTLKQLRNHVLFGEKPDNKYSYQILSYNSKNRNVVLDSLELNRNQGYAIELLDYNGLELCQGVIRYRDFRQSCPGTSTTTFIAIDSKGGFNKLLSSFNGTESSSTIYFPMKFESGKTLLVEDGNVEQIFNYSTGELNTFNFPKELNVPINQLIVETKIEYAGDIEGLSADEIEITRSDTIYYQWNGIKLNKIKTTGNSVYKN